MVLVVRGARNACRYALIALIAGAVVGIGHMVASRVLRGGTMPIDMVVYTTLVTLAFLLALRLPALWQGVNFETTSRAPGRGQGAATAAMAACDLLALTILLLLAPTHTIGGVNHADVGHITLAALGVALMVWGAIRLECSALRLEAIEGLRGELGGKQAVLER